MKFAETDLEILNSVADQTLHFQLFGELDVDNLIDLLSSMRMFKNAIDDQPANEVHLDETLAAFKSESICRFNSQTIDNLVAAAQNFQVDCSALTFTETDRKVRADIAKGLVGHAKEDCYIILTPLMLTVLQAGGDPSYKQSSTSFSAAGMHEVGMLDDVRVYCHSFAQLNDPIIVGTSDPVYAFTYNNVSFM